MDFMFCFFASKKKSGKIFRVLLVRYTIIKTEGLMCHAIHFTIKDPPTATVVLVKCVNENMLLFRNYFE